MIRHDRKVLIVSPVGEAGGAEHLLLDVAAQLQKRGWAVSIVALGPGPLAGLAHARGLNAKVGRAVSLSDPLSVVRTLRRLRRIGKPFRPTAVYCSHPKGHILAHLARLVPRGRLLVQLYDPPGRTRIDQMASHLDGRRVAIAQRTADAYSHVIRKGSVTLIEPGLDIEAFRQRAARGTIAVAYERASILPGTGLVAMAGRFQRFKGHMDFVRIAELIHVKMPNVRFLLIGPASPREPRFPTEVREEIARRGLNATVGLTGPIDDDDVAAVMGAADVFVHPAIGETFGLVLVEAMSVGTPVVAYHGPGPNRILSSGGVLVHTGDIEALAQAVQGLLLSPARRNELAAEARTQAMVFGIERVGERYEHELEELLAKRS